MSECNCPNRCKVVNNPIRLDLFKRHKSFDEMNILKQPPPSKLPKENGLVCLGFYDVVKIQEVKDFKSIVGSENNTLNGQAQSKHSLHLFNTSCETGQEGMSFVELNDMLQNHFVSITYLKYDNNVFRYDNADVRYARQLFCNVKKKINEILEEFKSLKSAIFASLGASDIVLFMSLTSISDFIGIVHKIRTLFYIDIGNQQRAFFNFASTQFVFNKNNTRLLRQVHKEQIDVEMRCSLCGALDIKKLIDEMYSCFIDKKHLENSSIDFSHATGDDDIIIRISTTFDNFLRLFIRDTKKKNPRWIPVLYYEIHASLFKTIHSIILLKYEKFKLPINNENGRFYNIDRDESSLLLGKYSKMLMMYEDLKHNERIPESISLTIYNIVYTCISLRNNPYKTGAFIRVLNLLTVMFKAIEDDCHHDMLISLKMCAIEISNMLHTVTQVDNIYVNGLNEIDTVSSYTKLFYAYLHILKLTCHTLHRVNFENNRKIHEPHIFLTVGAAERLCSKTYFPQIIKSNMKYICTINVPNASFFHLKTSYLPILHEVAHHLTIITKNEPRNTCFKNLISGYILKLIEKDYYAARLSFNEDKVKFIILDFFSEKNVSVNMFFEDYKNAIMQIVKVEEYYTTKYTHLLKNNFQYQETDECMQFIRIFHDTLSTLVYETPFNAFENTMRECRADFVMLYLSRLIDDLNSGINEYINMFVNEFQFRMDYSNNDKSFYMRITSIIWYILYKHNADMNDDEITKNMKEILKKKLTSENSKFLKPIIEWVIIGGYDFVYPIIKVYLNHFYDTKTLEALENTKIAIHTVNDTLITKSPMNFNMQEEIEFFFEHWYLAMKNLIKENLKNA